MNPPALTTELGVVWAMGRLHEVCVRQLGRFPRREPGVEAEGEECGTAAPLQVARIRPTREEIRACAA